MTKPTFPISMTLSKKKYLTLSTVVFRPLQFATQRRCRITPELATALSSYQDIVFLFSSEHLKVKYGSLFLYKRWIIFFKNALMKKHLIKIIMKMHNANVFSVFEIRIRDCKYIQIGCPSLLPWIIYK